MRLLIFWGCILLITMSCGSTKKSEATFKCIEILYGKHFGHCRGICRNELIFTPTNTIHRSSGNDLTAFPESKKELTHDVELWNTLSRSIQWNTFKSSEERIGCPDCADGGSEYIEIKTGQETKRITIENGSEQEFLEPLLSHLRKVYDAKIN